MLASISISSSCGRLTGNVDTGIEVVAGARAKEQGNGSRCGRSPGQVKSLACGGVVDTVGERVVGGKGQQRGCQKGEKGLAGETHV